MKRDDYQKGFTLAEIIVVGGIVAMIFGLTISSNLRAQQSTSLQSSSMLLVSDIKQQQINSMTGFTLGEDTTSTYGVYFEEDGYTLFKGTAYDPSDSKNFVVKLPENIKLSEIKFLNSTLLFSKGSGEVVYFSDGLNEISLMGLNKTVTISINKLGVLTGIN